MSLRSIVFLAILIGQASVAQRVDSVRIFRDLPARSYSTSSAETMGWRLFRAHGDPVLLGPEELAGLNEAIADARPAHHEHRPLPGLSHIGFAYLGRQAHVFCLSEDLSLVIDLTARRQFRISAWSDRIKLRALLAGHGL